MAEIAMKAIQRLCKKIAQTYISILSTKGNSKCKNNIKSSTGMKSTWLLEESSVCKRKFLFL